MSLKSAPLSIKYSFGRASLADVQSWLAPLGSSVVIAQDTSVTAVVQTVKDAVFVRTASEWVSERYYSGEMLDRLDGPAVTIRRPGGNVESFAIFGVTLTPEEHAAISKMAVRSPADVYYAKRGLAFGLDASADFDGPVWKRWPVVEMPCQPNWLKAAAKVIKLTGREGVAKIAKGPKLRGTFSVVCASHGVADGLAQDISDEGLVVSSLVNSNYGRWDYDPSWRVLANEDGQWPWEAAEAGQ